VYELYSRALETFGEAFGGQELLYGVIGNLHNSGVAVIVVVVVAGVMVIELDSEPLMWNMQQQGLAGTPGRELVFNWGIAVSN